jgi:1-acyl-sn-glycerol-3-phosphate acyltransferase
MVYQIIQRWATFFLRLYFRRTIIHGLEHIPTKGPLIVASNHPSAFMEASILGTVIRRPLHFLVRGDMFNPKFQWLFDWTNQIPIFRQKDGIGNLRKNASSFELTYKKLADGEAVLIFPEAKTVLEKKLRPIQRGTAHLAFGTLPYLKEGDQLQVLPVGVNFVDPRIPGTDVVVRFGPAFLTEQASREDRKAIDHFTEKLEESMRPLIIEVGEKSEEKDYDVLASVYLRGGLESKDSNTVFQHLTAIAKYISVPSNDNPLAEKLRAFRSTLARKNLKEAIYFPDLLLLARPGILFVLVMKCVWLISGGWLWRVTRSIIFAKIKKNTFQSPVSVGAAMVLYPVVAILLLLVCLIAGWPIWIVLIWMMEMIGGMFFRAPFHLIYRVLFLSPKVKQQLSADVNEFKGSIQAIIQSGRSS